MEISNVSVMAQQGERISAMESEIIRLKVDLAIRKYMEDSKDRRIETLLRTIQVQDETKVILNRHIDMLNTPIRITEARA